MVAYFRGNRVRIPGYYAWVQFPDSDNSRRVNVSDSDFA